MRAEKILFLLLTFLPCFAFSQEQILKEANEAYSAGEKAKTIKEREESFNKALALYIQLEQKDGIINFNIGNSFFQLEEYPLAILYYNRALEVSPRNEIILRNLQIAREKLGIKEVEEKSILDRLFFFKTSISERLEALFLLTVLFLILSSVYIWWRPAWLTNCMIIVVCLWVAISLSIGYTRYFTPLEGIVIKPTVLYRDAGEQYAMVSEDPVLPGSKLQVLSVVQNGKWLKVRTPEGDVGYLSVVNFRVI